ncbi:MAG: hypothetical protein NVS9B1_02490 [Candidatus Dormibacteraceae bacterium]
MTEVDPGLRRWFVVHFAVDWLIGLPLLLFPSQILPLLGWHPFDPVATRLFAAALLGIGGQSFLGRNGTPGEFRGMLNLKLIWSAGASFALAVGILHGSGPLAYLGLVTFIAFFALWAWYRRRLG